MIWVSNLGGGVRWGGEGRGEREGGFWGGMRMGKGRAYAWFGGEGTVEDVPEDEGAAGGEVAASDLELCGV